EKAAHRQLSTRADHRPAAGGDCRGTRHLHLSSVTLIESFIWRDVHAHAPLVCPRAGCARAADSGGSRAAADAGRADLWRRAARADVAGSTRSGIGGAIRTQTAARPEIVAWRIEPDHDTGRISGL